MQGERKPDELGSHQCYNNSTFAFIYEIYSFSAGIAIPL